MLKKSSGSEVNRRHYYLYYLNVFSLALSASLFTKQFSPIHVLPPWIAGALALSNLEDTMDVIVFGDEILRGNIPVLQVPPCTELQQYFI